MTVLLTLLLFLVGLGLAVQIVAAFYRIIDLWYAIRLTYTQVLRTLIIWCGLAAVIAMLLTPPWRQAFLAGIILYLPLYLLNYGVLRSVLGHRVKQFL
jgi:Ni,Fe-hydrogenase I cytochrome b subunit